MEALRRTALMNRNRGHSPPETRSHITSIFSLAVIRCRNLACVIRVGGRTPRGRGPPPLPCRVPHVNPAPGYGSTARTLPAEDYPRTSFQYTPMNILEGNLNLFIPGQRAYDILRVRLALFAICIRIRFPYTS